MKLRTVLPVAAMALATATTPVVASAAQHTPKKSKAVFVGTLKRSGETASLRVLYRCTGAEALWVSAKQTASGKPSKLLRKEGSSSVAATWYQSHRNAFTCDGKIRIARFTVDKVEPGSKGSLRKGRAYVQFCLSKSDEQIVVYKTGWVSVR